MLERNNSVQDGSLLDEKISREMFAAAGVPVPRSDWAVVTLNNQTLGLYVLVEGFNKQFLRRYFKNVSGNLYDGGFCREVNEDLAVNSGDKPDDRSDLRNLLKAASACRSKNSLNEITDVLDVDRFLSMIAMEIMIVHWDGYAMNRNNYRLYHDLDSGRMIFMPHGLDQMWGRPQERASSYTPILPRMNGYIANAVIGTTEGRARYMQRFGELRTNVFKVDAITNRVRQLQARIRPVLAEVYPAEYVRRHDSIVNGLCRRIVERSNSLNEQLAAREKSTTFDSNGAARLEGWRPRNNNGNGKVDINTNENGRKVLHVAADPGSTSSSWRTRVPLKPGRYRFEGFAKTRAAGRNELGADIRISGGTPQQLLHGDTEWTKIGFDFDVSDAEGEVELVCELRGTRGEAWFDMGSLKLRRLE